MTIQSLFFHSPPTWMIGALPLFALVSFVFVVLGVVFLVRHGLGLTSGSKAVLGLIPAFLIISSTVMGYGSTFPFGFFAGLPVTALLLGPASGDYRPFLLVSGCFLNALGIVGVISLFKRWVRFA